jgi:U6 snRNA-associated Sm-like protein LSm1
MVTWKEVRYCLCNDHGILLKLILLTSGIFIIRGENVVLLGEIDREREEQLNNSKLTQVSVEEILDAQRREIETKQEKSALLRSRLKQRGVYNNNPLLLEENE